MVDILQERFSTVSVPDLDETLRDLKDLCAQLEALHADIEARLIVIETALGI